MRKTLLSRMSQTWGILSAVLCCQINIDFLPVNPLKGACSFNLRCPVCWFVVAKNVKKNFTMLAPIGHLEPCLKSSVTKITNHLEHLKAWVILAASPHYTDLIQVA